MGLEASRKAFDSVLKLYCLRNRGYRQTRPAGTAIQTATSQVLACIAPSGNLSPDVPLAAGRRDRGLGPGVRVCRTGVYGAGYRGRGSGRGGLIPWAPPGTGL